MSVMDISVGFKGACLYFQTNGLVGITERHTRSSQFVYFLYREHWVVHWVVENVLFYLHLINNVGSHLQTVVLVFEGRKEHFLDYLQVAEIATWQVVHDEHHLLWKTLYLVALGTDKFKNIRILLVRHDA